MDKIKDILRMKLANTYYFSKHCELNSPLVDIAHHLETFKAIPGEVQKELQSYLPKQELFIPKHPHGPEMIDSNSPTPLLAKARKRKKA